VLYPALARHFGKPTETPGAFDRLLGADWLSDAVFVDQSPIGKTARSNPASYVGAFDALRKLFADAPLARERSYTPAPSASTPATAAAPPAAARASSTWRCSSCRRLPALPDCDGKRYRAEILDVKLTRGPHQLSVADVLDLTVAEAAHWFQRDREVVARAAAHRRRRPGLRAPGPAGADAQSAARRSA
jgi:excinuclease ABC subunit A